MDDNSELTKFLKEFTNNVTSSIQKLEGTIEKLLEGDRANALKYEGLQHDIKRLDNSNNDRKAEHKDIQLAMTTLVNKIEKMDDGYRDNCDSTKENFDEKIKEAIRNSNNENKTRAVIAWSIFIVLGGIICFFVASTFTAIDHRFIRDERAIEKNTDRIEEVNDHQNATYHNLEKFKRGEL